MQSPNYEPNECSIRFTRYAPSDDGVRQTQYIERTGDTLAKARAIEAAGYVFEVELLRSGVVSLEVVHGEVATDSVAHELCANEPGVVSAAQDRLIDTAMSVLNHREASSLPAPWPRP